MEDAFKQHFETLENQMSSAKKELVTVKSQLDKKLGSLGMFCASLAMQEQLITETRTLSFDLDKSLALYHSLRVQNYRLECTKCNRLEVSYAELTRCLQYQNRRSDKLSGQINKIRLILDNNKSKSS